jgi:hypothetical protein
MRIGTFMLKRNHKLFGTRPSGVGVVGLGVGFLANPMLCLPAVFSYRLTQFLDVA